jgi:LPS-assembly protein
MMRFLKILAAALLPLFGALPLAAQSAATLLADQISVTASGALAARGNVDAFFEGTRLSAAGIIYDPQTDRLVFEGPILIRLADGTMFTAERADLDPRLENGLLLGARMVLDRQLQFAASQISRTEGRHTELKQVVATSCQVCAGEAPLWEIRASSVTHDQIERQLYFSDAVFRIRGIPVFWLPWMRMPDPTLSRATGFLIPSLRSTDLLGVGLKAPYFIALGDQRDLTLTPYLSPLTTTIEARYRQAYLTGQIEVEAALTQDRIRPSETRGYLFAAGKFDLPDDYRLNFGVQTASDEGYLLDYGHSSADRLENFVGFSRFRPDFISQGRLTAYQGLLPDVTTESTPPVLGSARFERQLRPDIIGGLLRYGGEIEGHARPFEIGGTSRDVGRIGLTGAWQDTYVIGPGVIAETEAGLTLDAYGTFDHPLNEGFLARAQPEALLTLRWPLVRSTASGGVDVVEPVLAFAWSDSFGGSPVNEDGTRSELDSGNLFALSRFAGQDRIETGPRLAFGATWTRSDANGWSGRMTAGQIRRLEELADFSTTSGLSGFGSNWLVAGQLTLPMGLTFDGRALLSEEGIFGKSEGRIGWSSNRLDLSAGYVWLDADLDEDRPDEIAEWAFDLGYRINDVWSLDLSGRYDLATDRPATAGATIGWNNECVSVELSASRRYVYSTTVSSSTDLSLEIGLNGFSAGRSGTTTSRVCTN